jgi:hypothetical protein
MTMNHHDLDWLTAERPHEQTYDPAARERALQALLEHTSSPTRRRRRRRLSLRGLARARTFGVAAAAAAAAVTAVVVLSAGNQPARDLVPSTVAIHSTVHHHATVHGQAAVHHHRAVRSPLVRLADYVSTSATPAGDATLVARTTTTGGQTVTVYDLYADDGMYYFSPMESGLAGQVSAGHNLAGGLFAREVAAAKQAATGDVQTAAQNLADAPDPSHVISPDQKTNTAATAAKLAAIGQKGGAGSLYDNWVWEDAQDAIIAGSGEPAVRAGVLRILATLPGVTVTNGTSDGEPTLVLTAGTPEMGPGYTEQLTIDADTGVPIQFVGGPPNGTPATTVDYKVTRVTLSDLSSGTSTTA